MVSVYSALLWLCSLGFLVSVPLILAERARQPQRMPWWLVVVLAAAVGWLASNAYVCLENWQIAAEREEDLKQGIISDFFVVAPAGFAPRWGWSVGLVYLLICLGLYPVFRPTPNSAASRLFIALLIIGVALRIVTALPPWTTIYPVVPFSFVQRFAFFLLCAGLSFQFLRVCRLTAAWSPFVVMFVVGWVLDVALDYSLQEYAVVDIRASAEWAALLGALFTAFWWIAIRPGQAAPA